MDIESLSGMTLYVILFAVIFAESGILVGFWLPGDTILFAAGLVAADPAADVSIVVVAVGVAVVASAGAVVGYVTGSHLGRPYLERRHARALGRTEEFYRRFGAVTLIAARFVPWARTFAPVLAGAVAMPRHRFGVAVVIGAVVWGTGLTLLGYEAASIPGLRDAALWIALVVIVVSVLAGAVGELLRRRVARPRGLAAPAGPVGPARTERVPGDPGDGTTSD
ncbi:VTT domain-containing protein [Parafrankia sp. FMc6]|uniref:DedA family protein n=1 Tax=Parafrankia soli TaxID=2599596 RepID=UPI0034D76333